MTMTSRTCCLNTISSVAFPSHRLGYACSFFSGVGDDASYGEVRESGFSEYQFGYTVAVNNSENTETVVSPPGNVGLGDNAPMQIRQIPAQIVENSSMTRGSYVFPTPLGYRAPMASSGYFQAGQHSGGSNREQQVVYSYIPGGNREQPVVYSFIPVMPSAGQEQTNIPMSGSPLSYDAPRGEFQHPTTIMVATSNHESNADA